MGFQPKVLGKAGLVVADNSLAMEDLGRMEEKEKDK